MNFLKSIIKSLLVKRPPEKFSRDWYRTVLDRVLNEEREKSRIAFTNGDISAEKILQRIDEEIVRRANDRYRKEHPNAKPRPPREHGWNLLKND